MIALSAIVCMLAVLVLFLMDYNGSKTYIDSKLQEYVNKHSNSDSDIDDGQWLIDSLQVYIYIYIYMCVCVCVCARERECLCVCLLYYIYMYICIYIYI